MYGKIIPLIAVMGVLLLLLACQTSDRERPGSTLLSAATPVSNFTAIIAFKLTFPGPEGQEKG